MTILLVRHGETVDNASRIFQTPTSRLSDSGHAQASLLAERLAGANISDIVCSDYVRTKETANYVAEQIGIVPNYTELLRERSFGDIRGRPYDELSFDPFDLNYQPLNGESWAVFDARVARAWGHISLVTEKAKGDVLLVTHGFVCRSVVANHVTLAEGLQVPVKWSNTSLTEIQPISPWLVGRLNCVEHLDGRLNQQTDQTTQV